MDANRCRSSHPEPSRSLARWHAALPRSYRMSHSVSRKVSIPIWSSRRFPVLWQVVLEAKRAEHSSALFQHGRLAHRTPVEMATVFFAARIALPRSLICYLLVIVICTSVQGANARLDPVTHYSICHDVD